MVQSILIVRLANHIAGVHRLDAIQRKKYLQEAKLQPKIKVVIYENHNFSKPRIRSSGDNQEIMYTNYREQGGRKHLPFPNLTKKLAKRTVKSKVVNLCVGIQCKILTL